MSEWKWFRDFTEQARERGDQARAQLGHLHDQAYWEPNPDDGIRLAKEGIIASMALNEPWWQLLFEYWIVQLKIYRKRNFKDVLDPAVRNVLTLRRPEYQAYPHRLWIYGDLVHIYIMTDPLSLRREIADTLREGREELAKGRDESEFLLLFHELDAAHNQAEWAEARRLAARIRDKAQAHEDQRMADHYLVPTYRAMCYLYSEIDQWDEVRRWSAVGREVAVAREKENDEAVFLLWEANSLFAAGDFSGAAKVFQAACSQRERAEGAVDCDYFNAMCLYLENTQQFEQAFRERTVEIEICQTDGRRYDEFASRLKRIQLSKRLGIGTDEQISELRTMVNGFRQPDLYWSRVSEYAVG